MAYKKNYGKKKSSGKKNNRRWKRKPLTAEQKRKRAKNRHYWVGFGIGIAKRGPFGASSHLSSYAGDGWSVHDGYRDGLETSDRDQHEKIYG